MEPGARGGARVPHRQDLHATPGAYVLAPPGVSHGFRNSGAVPARALNLHTPGGFARYWRELTELQAGGTEPDGAFFERHDVYDVEQVMH